MTFYVLLLVEMDSLLIFFINSFVVFNEFDFNMQNYSWTLLQPDLKFFVGNGSGRVRTPMQTLGCSKSVEEDFYLTSRYNESPLINHSSRHTHLCLRAMAPKPTKLTSEPWLQTLKNRPQSHGSKP